MKDDNYCALSSNPVANKDYYNNDDSSLANPNKQTTWVDLSKGSFSIGQFLRAGHLIGRVIRLVKPFDWSGHLIGRVI